MHRDVGPLYCETPIVAGGFPIEFVNTWTNLIIMLFGVFAFAFVQRTLRTHSVTQRLPYYIVSFLLTATGVGSFLWHGLRTDWALALDVAPGILTLFVLSFLWARLAYGWAVGIGLLVFLFGAQSVVFEFMRFSIAGGVLAFVLSITIPACILAWRTFKVDPIAGVVSAGMIVSALSASGARFSDRALCEVTGGIGTHFLWHIFLSFAAFLGVVVVVRLRAQTKV